MSAAIAACVIALAVAALSGGALKVPWRDLPACAARWLAAAVARADRFLDRHLDAPGGHGHSGPAAARDIELVIKADATQIRAALDSVAGAASSLVPAPGQPQRTTYAVHGGPDGTADGVVIVTALPGGGTRTDVVRAGEWHGGSGKETLAFPAVADTVVIPGYLALHEAWRDQPAVSVP